MIGIPTGIAPEFRLTINDQDIPSALRRSVTSVSYTDGTGAADRVEVGIANADLRWIQEHIKGLGFQPFPTGVSIGPVGMSPVPAGLFDVDNKLCLEMGYAGEPLSPMFEGDITGVDASFPSGGMPSMTVVAHDYLHRLTEGEYARGFGPLDDATITAILGAENLLAAAIDPAVAGAAVALGVINYVFGGTGRKQKGQSDLQLLQEIAHAYDADFWVDGSVLYFSRFFFKEYAPSVSLVWGESLLDFSPKVTTVGRVAAVSMKFTLREIPLSFLVTVFWDFDHETLGIEVIPAEAASVAKQLVGPAFTIVDCPITSPADVLQSALAITRELRSRLNNRLTGKGTAVGDPRIRAGSVILLDGLGPNFSGLYRVTSATHSVDAGGYRTRFEVRKEIIP